MTQMQAVWSSHHVLAPVAQGSVDHTPAIFAIDPAATSGSSG
ncbi:MAG TPA: hypothetical protein VEK76_01855 [Candidatus Binatia bacterium]|nr:hypothetical protein [Candidatus Binatia bacterium]